MIFNKNVLMINSDTNVAKPLHGVNGFIYSVFAIFYGCIESVRITARSQTMKYCSHSLTALIKVKIA